MKKTIANIHIVQIFFQQISVMASSQSVSTWYDINGTFPMTETATGMPLPTTQSNVVDGNDGDGASGGDWSQQMVNWFESSVEVCEKLEKKTKKIDLCILILPHFNRYPMS